MSKPKEINLFPGSNTSKGFYSFYRYILTQDNANRILCLKGGPGTGKSSLMKKVGKKKEKIQILELCLKLIRLDMKYSITQTRENQSSLLKEM